MKIVLIISVVLFVLIGFAYKQIQNMLDKTEKSNLNQTERYLQDLKFISKMPRLSGDKHHTDVQKLCATSFEQLGFNVDLHHYGSGVNIIGTLPGKKKPTEKILVSAHYDSVPDCNGADDNASGVAGVLETARLLAAKPHNRTLVLACWDEEENGLIGSREYVLSEKNKQSDIKMSFVYEMIAYKANEPNSQQIPPSFETLYPKQVEQIQKNKNRGDFIILVYDEQGSEMLPNIISHAQNQNLPLIKMQVNDDLKNSDSISDLRRSDHASFWDADFPAVMITDTANFRNPNYHCINGADNIEGLDINFAIKTINTLAKTIEETLDGNYSPPLS